MKPDADLLAELMTDPSRERPCTFAKLLDSLGDASRLAIEQAFEQGRSAYLISETLGRKGLAVNASTAARHLKGRCSCPK